MKFLAVASVLGLLFSFSAKAERVCFKNMGLFVAKAEFALFQNGNLILKHEVNRIYFDQEHCAEYNPATGESLKLTAYHDQGLGSDNVRSCLWEVSEGEHLFTLAGSTFFWRCHEQRI